MGRKGLTPSNFKDLTDMRFGLLTVIKRADNIRDRCAWLCRCDCGNESIVKAIYLTTGDTRSCGCLYRKNLIGKVFGRLTVMMKVKGTTEQSEWLCQCSCGNQKIVKCYHLTSGGTKSCGCYSREIHSAIGKKFTIHGLSHTKIYNAWKSMIDRCYNSSSKCYKNYGARGINVCEEWLNDFLTFREWAINNGCAKGLSIERKDVNGNYELSNCTWIPLGEQSLNRRNTRRITINGITRSVQEWAKSYGIKPTTIYNRLRYGFTGESLVSKINKNYKKSIKLLNN